MAKQVAHIEPWQEAVRDVADFALQSLEGDGSKKDLETLKRLTSDERMARVWREIYRGRVSSDEFFNPAIISLRVWAAIQRWGFLTRVSRRSAGREILGVKAFSYCSDRVHPIPPICLDWHEQDLAAQSLFLRALTTLWDSEPIDSSALKKVAEEYSKIKHDLESARARLTSSQIDTPIELVIAEVEKILSALSENESSSRKEDPRLIRRRRGNIRARIFIKTFSKDVEHLFGKSLEGCIAIFASVLFEETYTRDQIHAMMRPGG